MAPLWRAHAVLASGGLLNAALGWVPLDLTGATELLSVAGHWVVLAENHRAGAPLLFPGKPRLEGQAGSLTGDGAATR